MAAHLAKTRQRFFRLREQRCAAEEFRIVLLRNARETHRGMRAMLFRIPLLLDAIAMREGEGGSVARRRGWSPDCNCSGKPEARNYAMYRTENCVLSFDGFCMHSGMRVPPSFCSSSSRIHVARIIGDTQSVFAFTK